jgi:hypothetical protein
MRPSIAVAIASAGWNGCLRTDHRRRFRQPRKRSAPPPPLGHDVTPNGPVLAERK